MKRVYKSFLIPVLLLSSIDIYAACTIGGTAFNEAGRPGAGVTVVTGTDGGLIAKDDIQMWGLGDDITTCDVAQITDMSMLLADQVDFDQDISSWDVSNATTMEGMFMSAPVFDQDISNWDVSNVTTMSNMFDNASMFDQDISNWDVSSVTTMRNMFVFASNFNQDI